MFIEPLIFAFMAAALVLSAVHYLPRLTLKLLYWLGYLVMLIGFPWLLNEGAELGLKDWPLFGFAMWPLIVGLTLIVNSRFILWASSPEEYE